MCRLLRASARATADATTSTVDAAAAAACCLEIGLQLLPLCSKRLQMLLQLLQELLALRMRPQGSHPQAAAAAVTAAVGCASRCIPCATITTCAYSSSSSLVVLHMLLLLQ